MGTPVKDKKDRAEPASLPEYLLPVWREIAGNYPVSSDLELEAVCGLVHRLRDARERIEKDGIIVLDKAGHPVPHPALETERQAQRELRAWESSPGAKMSRAHVLRQLREA